MPILLCLLLQTYAEVEHRIAVYALAPSELSVGIFIFFEPFVICATNLFPIINVSVGLLGAKTRQGKKTVDFIVQDIVPSISG
jgi:hypothetical protein